MKAIRNLRIFFLAFFAIIGNGRSISSQDIHFNLKDQKNDDVFQTVFFEKNINGSQIISPLIVAFDWGNVLVTSSYDNFYEFIKDSFNIDNIELNNVLVDLRKSRDLAIKERDFWNEYSIKKNVKLSSEWFILLEKIKLSCLTPNVEMFQIVQKLKERGIKIVVFSNTTYDKANMLRRAGYYDNFDDVILSCDIGYKKPNPKAYDILLSKLNIDPHKVIFVDDKIVNILAAKEKGIYGILFVSANEFKEELEKYNPIKKINIDD